MHRIHIVRSRKVSIQGNKIVWHESGDFGPLISIIRMFITGIRILRKNRIDMIITFNPVPYGTTAWILSRIFKRPISMSLIGDDINVHCRAWYAPLIHFVLRRCDRVTVPGLCYLEDVVNWGVNRESVHILPHSIDLNRFRPFRPTDDRQYDFLFVGDLLPLKNVDIIIEAFAGSLTCYPSSRMAIIGDGRVRGDLERKAGGTAAGESIDFLGRKENVEDYYNDARVLVLASEREALPLVLLEGMACGCVPVATDRGVINEYVENGRNGFLIREADAGELKEVFLNLLEDRPLLRDVSKKAAGIRERVGWEEAERTWSQIISSQGTKGKK